MVIGSLKICSYNCRGLNNTKKRYDLFSLFKEKNTDILCLQETHFFAEIETKIYQQWEGNCIFSHGNSNSKGVAILFKKGIDIKVLSYKTDTEGQFIALKLLYKNTSIILANVYAPNIDNPNFFDYVFNEIESFDNNENIILCGDFNLVLDTSIDYENYKHLNHNARSRKYLLNKMNDRDLIDPFRQLHGKTRKYTWKRLTPLQRGRLDFFLMTLTLLPCLRNCDIDISYKSDHSIIFLELQLSEQNHGKGFWKLNNSLLNDKAYVDCINRKIDSVILQYCLPVYNIDNVLKMEPSDIQFIINDQLFLETLLMEIRGETISYSSHKAKTKCQREKNIEDEIVQLENNLNETNKDRLTILNDQLENLRQEKLNGYFTRARANWVENGERATKYFCNLEKQHIASKNIPFLVKDDGNHTYDQNEILVETKKYFENLFDEKSSNIDNKFETYMKDCEANKLDEKNKNAIEGLLQYSEVTEILRNMKNDKSPGIDGFTTNFYKVFWKRIGHFVVKALNHAFLTNSFSKNIKLGIITLIPKEDKPKQFLRNWRPITLLNVLYKLASGSIARRIKNVLNHVISGDQTGFLQDRFIGENTRLVYDIMQQCEEHHIPGLLMLIDFEKAFDSLSFNFTENTLTYFNFGETFKQWIKLFLYNTEVSVQLNGFLSEYFTIRRGCRQGDPISAYVFILCTEILNIKIKHDKNITGIKIKNQEYIISQFADDTTLFLDGSEKTLNSTLEMLEHFSHISGLKVNFDKTKLIWIGSMKYSIRAIKTKWKLTWGETQFKLLGILFHVDLEKMLNLNYEPKLQSIRNSISHWKKRKLTPIGKIIVVKSILVPILTHLFISLPSPTNEFLKRIHDILYKFVWDGPAKIKHSVMIKDYVEGGLRMIDIKNFNTTMKLKWMKKIVANSKNDCYKFITNIFDPERVFNFGTLYCKKILGTIKNEFWIDVLKSFMVFSSKYKFTKLSEIMTMPLFYNENITIDSKYIYDANLYKCGIRYVKDILRNDGCFKSLNEIKNVTKNGINFLNYYSIVNSVKAFFSHQDIPFPVTHKILNECHNPSINSYFFHIITKNDINKHVYNTLIKNDETPTSRNKWSIYYNGLNLDWKQIHGNVFKYTRDTYTQWLQTRIVHRIIATNALLFKMKLINTNLCTFCGTDVETITHLFYECRYTKTLISRVTEIIKNFNQTVQINSSILLLGSNTTNIKLDILLLEIKKYIYFCRNKLYKPSINGLRNHLTTNLNVYRNTKMFEKGENIMTFVEHIIQNLP